MLILARFMIATMIAIVLIYLSNSRIVTIYSLYLHVFYVQTIVVADTAPSVSSTPQSTSPPVTNYPQAILLSTHILYTSYYYSSLSTIFYTIILLSITLFPSHLYLFSLRNL